MNVLSRDGKETAREYAFRVIEYNIISSHLPPGSMVSENELAKEMGISRTPVREALIELSKIRLVEIYPQRGSYISLIDTVLVEEARYVRLLLEKSMVELTCEMAEKEDILALEENVRLQEFYLSEGIRDKLLELDNEFHRLLYKISNKTFTYELISKMMAHFDRVRSLSLSVIKDSKNIADHRNLLDAIKSKDASLAKEIITKHLSRYKLDEEQLKKEYPDYFKKL